MEAFFEDTMGRNWVVEEMAAWIEKASKGELEDREDLVVCATHMLAAMGRKGTPFSPYIGTTS
jgi:hypothetical protein